MCFESEQVLVIFEFCLLPLQGGFPTNCDPGSSSGQREKKNSLFGVKTGKKKIFCQLVDILVAFD